MLYHHIAELIGDTPLLRLDPGRHALPGVELYAKLELFNPFGSVKDRVARGMLAPHLDELVARDQTLIEASSGNTGKALQVLAGLAGIDVEVLSNRAKVPEVRDILVLLGARLEELPGLSECPDPNEPDDVFTMIEQRMAVAPGRYRHLSQYTNPDNRQAHHDTTGAEIAADLDRVDYLFGGVGTAGSTGGVAARLRERDPLVTVGVVSTGDDFIPGIRSETELWEVGLFRPRDYDELLAVRSADAVAATVELCRRHGVLGGPTSGATYHAVRTHFTRHPVPAGSTANVVMIVCDRIEPYLSYIRARRPDLLGATSERPLAGPGPDEVADAPTVTPSALARDLAEPGHLIVDTRGAMAYRVAHIPGSINIRDDLLVELARQGCPFAPPLRVTLVCPVGMRSLQLTALLRRTGCVASALAGGVVAWRSAQLPMASGPETVQAE